MKTCPVVGPKCWSYSVWKSTGEVENAQCDSAMWLYNAMVAHIVQTVHEVWQRFLTTRNITTALTFLYCGTSARLAFAFTGIHLHTAIMYMQYANDAGSHNSMQSIEHCTGGHTKLHAVRACCTVCNTHGERSCQAIAEWVMFEADLWNVDSLSRANFFGSGTALISESRRIASQRQCCQERPSLRFKGTAKFLLQAPGAVYICNGGRRKVDRKGTSASRTNQIQAVLLEKIGHSFTSLHGKLRVGHRQTDTLTDGRSTIKAHGISLGDYVPFQQW